MDKLAAALQPIINKLIELFDVFDFSFFIAGSATTFAMAWCVFSLGLADPSGQSEVLLGAMGVVLAYTSGLISFGFGRAVRRRLAGPWLRRGQRPRTWGPWRRTNRYARLELAVVAHGLHEDTWLQTYTDRSATLAGIVAREAQEVGREQAERLDALYTRLWAEVRQDPEAKVSFDLMRSYWVRAAIYDGLASSIVAWVVAISLVTFGSQGAPEWPSEVRLVLVAVALVVGILGVVACFNEARRCDLSQVEELVATATWHAAARHERAIEALAATRASSPDIALRVLVELRVEDFLEEASPGLLALAAAHGAQAEPPKAVPAEEILVATFRQRLCEVGILAGAPHLTREAWALAAASPQAWDLVLVAARAAVDAALEGEAERIRIRLIAGWTGDEPATPLPG